MEVLDIAQEFLIGKTFLFEELSISQNSPDPESVLWLHPQMLSAVYTLLLLPSLLSSVFPDLSSGLHPPMLSTSATWATLQPFLFCLKTSLHTICWLSLPHPSMADQGYHLILLWILMGSDLLLIDHSALWACPSDFSVWDFCLWQMSIPQ